MSRWRRLWVIEPAPQECLLNVTRLIFRPFPKKKSSSGYVSIRLAPLCWHLAFSAQTVNPRPNITPKRSKRSKNRPKSRVTIRISRILLFFSYFREHFAKKCKTDKRTYKKHQFLLLFCKSFFIFFGNFYQMLPNVVLFCTALLNLLFYFANICPNFAQC